jgi:protein O-GlcNAc transferase
MHADAAALASILTALSQGNETAAGKALASLKQRLPASAAVVAINALLQRRPDWIPALDELGRSMLQLQEHRAAFNIGARILTLSGDDARGLELQVLAMELAGARAEQVLPLRRRLAALRPDSAPHQFMLATTASRVGYYAEMHAALDAALRIEPNLLLARWAKFLTPRDKFFASRTDIDAYVAAWDEGCAAFERLDLESPAMRPRLEGLMLAQCNFHLAYTGIDVTSRQRRLGRVLRRMATAAFPQFDRPLAPAAGTHRRLRIGFLTATLRHHTVLKLFGGLMRRLPRERFEICAYALESGTDAATDRLRGELDLVRTEIGSLATMAQRIRDDACDALVYIDIGMHPRSVALSAMRLAPFQAMLWGHPVTSGVDTIDAFLSSALMEPANGANHYNERLLPLPGLGCWYDPEALPLQPSQVQRTSATTTRIVCAQNGLKLLPEQDAVFARILAAAPAAELVLLCGLHAGIDANLLARMRPVFAAHGVDFDHRVRVVGHVDEPTFLSELWQADVVLDALSWSGGVTAFETFWGDVPILTLPGAFMRGRHTAAMLQALDLQELIAADVDDLVAKAVALAQDAEARARLRAAIGERKHRLYRDDRVVDAFAALLTREIEALRA